jgi:hypothetical protein
MDEHDLGSRHAYGASMSDDIDITDSKGSPGLIITSAMDSGSSHYRRHSRSRSGDARMTSIDEDEGIRDEQFEIVQPPSPLKLRRPSAGHSAATSMLRRLTTKMKPMSRAAFKSTKRSRGQEYATLGDGEDHHDHHDPGVDISSLEGLGWELTDLAGPDTVRFDGDNTEYVSPATTRKPDFRSFVDKRTSVGYGMKNIGVQLRRDPTRLARRGTIDDHSATTSAVEPSQKVKDFGRSLAQEKNMIVEVDEVFDLSTLDGGQPDNRRSQTFETMSMRNSVMPQETKSYFFPPDPDIPNWKPWSMSTWYILALMGLALGLAGFQEFLCQKSFRSVHEKSGILAFNAVADVSTWDFFAWKCEL